MRGENVSRNRKRGSQHNNGIMNLEEVKGTLLISRWQKWGAWGKNGHDEETVLWHVILFEECE